MEQTKENVENQDKLVRGKQDEEQIRREILIDSSEEIKAILGDSYLKNYFKTGQLKQSFAILTDRRVYMRGQCYEKKGLFKLKKQNVDKVLDVQDITGTEYKCMRKIWKLVLKWLLIAFIGVGCITIPIFYIQNFSQYSLKNKFAWFVAGAIEVVVRLLLVKLALRIRTNYEFLAITFSGGQLAYDCNIATTTEVKEFQRQMRLAKDKKVFNNDMPKENKVMVDDTYQTTVSTTNKLQDLKNLRELLDSGVITESEFNSLKSDIMEN